MKNSNKKKKKNSKKKLCFYNFNLLLIIKIYNEFLYI